MGKNLKLSIILIILLLSLICGCTELNDINKTNTHSEYIQDLKINSKEIPYNTLIAEPEEHINEIIHISGRTYVSSIPGSFVRYSVVTNYDEYQGDPIDKLVDSPVINQDDSIDEFIVTSYNMSTEIYSGDIVEFWGKFTGMDTCNLPGITALIENEILSSEEYQNILNQENTIDSALYQPNKYSTSSSTSYSAGTIISDKDENLKLITVYNTNTGEYCTRSLLKGNDGYAYLIKDGSFKELGTHYDSIRKIREMYPIKYDDLNLNSAKYPYEYNYENKEGNRIYIKTKDKSVTIGYLIPESKETMNFVNTK